MGIFWSELGKLVFSKSHRSRIGEIRDWEKRMFAAPSPSHVKRSTLRRNGNPFSIWVETGTFQGDTTQFLADMAKIVHSIEPEPTLFRLATERFKSTPNVQLHFGLSENVLPDLLQELTGDVNFWLDGHYSGGITHKGPIETPIVQELETIERYRERFTPLTVMIDDIRCFHPHIQEFSSYPDLELIIDWARKNNLKWHIEQDIFVAKT
jgi:hypothetical protein